MLRNHSSVRLDPLAYSLNAAMPQDVDLTIFAPTDEIALEKARAVAEDAHLVKNWSATYAD